MRTKQFKTIFSVFFLLLFISSKAAILHSLVHDHEHVQTFGYDLKHSDDHEHDHEHDHNNDSNSSECELCISVFTAQFAPIDFGVSEIIDHQEYQVYADKVVNTIKKKIYGKPDRNSLYTRPPPFLG